MHTKQKSVLLAIFLVGILSVACGSMQVSNTNNTIIAVAGTGGRITPEGAITINKGSDAIFFIRPDSGWIISDVIVDGSSTGSVTWYEFKNVDADHQIEASFFIPMITASAGENGSINPPGEIHVSYNENQLFTMIPDFLHVIDEILVDGANVGAVTAYEFESVTIDHEIRALFAFEGILEINSDNGWEAWYDNSQALPEDKYGIYSSEHPSHTNQFGIGSLSSSPSGIFHRACIRFPLSSIPAGYDVASAEILLYINETAQSGITFDNYGSIGYDPAIDTAFPDTFFNSCNGSDYGGCAGNNPGWITRNLGTNAVSDLNSAISQSKTVFGITLCSEELPDQNKMIYWYNHTSQDNKPRLRLILADKDQ